MTTMSILLVDEAETCGLFCASESKALEALALGARKVISKPFSVEVLYLSLQGKDVP